MSETPDHYSILGLIPNAELVVIKAAYRALAAIYHPDKNGNPEAEEKMRQINAAYETLSDPAKRKLYDKARQSKEHSASSSAFEQKQPFSNDPTENAWNIAVGFYPAVDEYYRDLGKISWQLAFAFRLQLLEEKKYAKAESIAKNMKTQYLSRYFGGDKGILNYAEKLIKTQEIQAAIYLNQIVNIMGSSVDIFHIVSKVNEKFPHLLRRRPPSLNHALHRLYNRIKTERGYDIDAAIELINVSGGSVRRPIFIGLKITASIDGESHSFNNKDEFCQYVLHRYREYA